MVVCERRSDSELMRTEASSGDGAIVRVMSPQRAKVCERVWLVAVVVVPVYLLAPAPTQL